MSANIKTGKKFTCFCFRRGKNWNFWPKYLLLRSYWNHWNTSLLNGLVESGSYLFFLDLRYKFVSSFHFEVKKTRYNYHHRINMALRPVRWNKVQFYFCILMTSTWFGKKCNFSKKHTGNIAVLTQKLREPHQCIQGWPSLRI